LWVTTKMGGKRGGGKKATFLGLRPSQANEEKARKYNKTDFSGISNGWVETAGESRNALGVRGDRLFPINLNPDQFQYSSVNARGGGGGKTSHFPGRRGKVVWETENLTGLQRGAARTIFGSWGGKTNKMASVKKRETPRCKVVTSCPNRERRAGR